jgi:hypothetical protein
MYLYIPVQLCSLVNTFNNICICIYPCAALWWGKCRTCYPSLPPVDGGWVQPPHGPADRGSPKVCVKRMPRPPDSFITKGPLPEVHVQGWIQPPHAPPPRSRSPEVSVQGWLQPPCAHMVTPSRASWTYADVNVNFCWPFNTTHGSPSEGQLRQRIEAGYNLHRAILSGGSRWVLEAGFNLLIASPSKGPLRSVIEAGYNFQMAILIKGTL